MLFGLLTTANAISSDMFFEVVRGKEVSPTTSIHGITKDSLGYIWFGSWSGLYRYNGSSFDLFSHKQDDTLSLPSNRIRNLITDENQQLWIFTFNNKYIKYNYNQDYFLTIPDSLVPDNVALLLSYNSNQLYRDKIINGYSYYLSDNLLTSYHTETRETQQYYSNIWQPGALIDDYITSFYVDDQDIIWLGARGGTVYKADTNRKPFNLFHLVNWFSKQPVLTSVRSILKTEKELWLGTNNDGMFIFKNGKPDLSHPYYSSGSDDDQIRAIMEDKKGRMWIGGINGISCYDPGSQKSTVIFNKALFPDVGASSVYCLIASGDGNLWAGIYNGLIKINVDTYRIRIYDFSEIIEDHSVMDLVEDRYNNIWLATEGSGVLKIDLDSAQNVSQLKHIDNKGFDGERLQGNLVYALYEDKMGAIWAGSSEALNRIDPHTYNIKSFGLEEGLQDQYISSVTGDKEGNIWMAHKKGISKLVPGSWQVFNYSHHEQSMNWAFLDGASFNDTLNNTIYFGAREGYVAFEPDLIHSYKYRPRVLFSKLFVSGVEVKPGKKVNGQQILSKVLSNTESIVLNYNNSSFSIEMVSLNYQTKGGGVMYYKLEDYDEEYLPTKHNVITYSKLPQGHYILSAYAITSDGVESDIIKLKMKVKPPWYASSLAYLLYVLTLLVILYVFYRLIISRERLKSQLLIEKLNVEKQEEVNKEKIDFFTNVSHELKTPLTLIIDPIKQLKNKHLSIENKTLYLDLIERNVANLSNLINQLLDFRKSETRKVVPEYSNDDGVIIIKGVLQTFKIMANARKVDLRFNSAVDSLIGYFDKEKLEKILVNLISNALKYTPNGGIIEVDLGFNRDANTYTILIKDDGVGIEREALNNIFKPFNNEGTKPFYGYSSGMGLTITKNYVDILGGSIHIESDKRNGTLATLVMPFNASGNDTFGHGSKTQISQGDTMESTDALVSILIVEDNPDVMTYLLNELGADYNLMSENNGEDGLKSALKNIPDLIISDVMMPKMDGISMCNMVKANIKTSHIPVILLTAKGSDDDKIVGLKSGADIYIPKPFSMDVLKAQIKSILENRKKLQNKLADKRYLGDVKIENIDIDKAFLDKLISIVKQNLENVNFNAEELAASLKISQRQLYRKLKAISGSTVQEFIVRVRMDTAAELLKTGNLRISEVAYKVGFTEPSNFSRTFSKHFACSPSKYKAGNFK